MAHSAAGRSAAAGGSLRGEIMADYGYNRRGSSDDGGDIIYKLC